MKQLYLLLITATLVQGCAGFSLGQGGPRQGQIVMGEREEIEINAMTNETEGGQPIEDFYCPGIIICEQYANTKFCSCQTGEIYLPSSMRF